MNPFQVHTFGCKVNHHDSSLIRSRLKEAGFQEGDKIAVLNTCAVTETAGREALRQAKKLKERNQFVVVTGCGAQIDTALYESSPHIDLIVANSHKKHLPDILKQPDKQKVFKSNIFKSEGIYSGEPAKEPDRTRVFLKIQDGCDSFCSFCIIPFARGKSQSLPLKSLVQSIRRLTDSGVREVTLTGVHIGDYSDGENKLEDLVQKILQETSIPRLRLTSLEPVELTEKLLESFQNPRMCPHFHLSVQSASSPVLKAMRRKYGRREVERALSKLENTVPKAFVGMDVIAGFPDEGDRHFEETYKVLKDSRWTRIHVFPYSPRRKMSRPQNERSLILRRAGLLRHLSETRYERELKRQQGTEKQVLLFKTNNQKGLSRDYWKTLLPSSARQGEHRVLIKGVQKETGALLGQFVTA